MHARFLDMFHDPGDEGLRAVAQHIDIHFGGIAEVGIDQHRAGAGNPHSLPHIAFQPGHVVHDLHGATSQHIGRTQQHGEAQSLRHRLRFLVAAGDAVGRLAQVKALQQVLEAVAVLRQVDGIDGGAEDGDPGIQQPLRQAQRGLATELHDDADDFAALFFRPHDLQHRLDGQRLEIKPVGGVVIRRDRLRIAVDHDGLVARFLQREAGMDTAIVELDTLADAVRTAPEDDDLAPVRRLGLALRANQFTGGGGETLVGRIHVGGGRFELGGAGVDALVDRRDTGHAPGSRHARLRCPGQLRDAGITETHLLQLQPAPGRGRQALFAHPLLGGHDLVQPVNEPRVVAGDADDAFLRDAETQRLRRHQQAVRRRAAQRGDQRILVIALDQLIVQAVKAGLHGPERLLQALVEAPAHRHRLAHRLHGGGQVRLGARKLLEREARDLGDHIVDRRLEARRGHAGDVIVQFVQRVADRQLRRDLGDRETRGLRRQRGGARHAGVHLDHHQPPVVGIDRELHVRSAGIHADLPQHRNRGVAHDLVFLVGQGQRGRDRDRIAGVDTHRIHILDGADDDAVVRMVADHLHLELLPAQHRFLDQHLRGGGGVEAAGHDLLELVAVVGDAAAGAAHGEGRADDGGQADLRHHVTGFGQGLDHGTLRHGEADAGHGGAEQVPVLRHGDGFLPGADQLDTQPLQRAVVGQRQCRVQRRLPAHGGQQGVGAFLLDDLGDHFRCHRLHIGGIGEFRVRHDGGGVGVHQDDPVALLPQCLAGLGAGIVEFAGLADDDRPRPDDHDGSYVGAFRHWRRSSP